MTITILDTSSIRDFRYLTFQGGGMKGIGYVGAVEELDRQGILAQIEEVAGSSAGGLIATLLAVGCTPEEIRQEMVGIDFKSFQDKKEPGFFESAIADKAKVVDDIVDLVFGSGLGVCEGDRLRYWLSTMIARKTGDPNITFKQLEELTKIPGGNFKKLILTGSNIVSRDLEYFNAATTPDMPIVEAARISASFPFAYKPTKKKDPSGKKGLLVDGGLLENLPDVFNKSPYATRDGLTEKGANPKVFALGFIEQDIKDESEIKGLLSLGEAVVKAKLSEREQQKKYGNNIALVDTFGMGILEFDASKEKRDKLAASGSKATVDAINNILEQESRAKPDYESMPVTELVRREIALYNMLQRDPLTNEQIRELKEQSIILAKELKSRLDLAKTNQEELESIRNQEYSRLVKVAQKRFAQLDDQLLSKICENKIIELERIKQELSEKIANFSIASNALQYDKNQVIDQFEQSSVFREELASLAVQEQQIDDNLNQKIALNLNMKLSIFEKNNQNKLLDREYKKLQDGKVQYLKALIEKYSRTNNESLSNFFANLLDDSGKISFFVPDNVGKLQRYFSEKLSLNESNIGAALDSAKNQLSKLNGELERFKQQKDVFASRKTTATYFAELVAFKNELDQSIKSKTTPLVKLNNFIIGKAPKLKSIVTPFLQATAFFTFALCLPIAAPVAGVAKVVERLSKDQSTKKTAKSVLNYFSCTDLKLNNRLREFRNIASNILSSNQSTKYLPKLYDHYFNGTNITMDDFIKTVAKETNIDPTNVKLDSNVRDPRVLKDPRGKKILSLTNHHIAKAPKYEKSKPNANKKQDSNNPNVGK